MAEIIDVNPQTGAVQQGASEAIIRTAHVVYGLHALSVLIALTSAATIVGAFLFGWPSLIAVVINYVKRDEAMGTFVESHFAWQIRTFWAALGWCVVSWVCLLTIIGIPVAFAMWGILSLWVIYRIARGWLALREGRGLGIS